MKQLTLAMAVMLAVLLTGAVVFEAVAAEPTSQNANSASESAQPVTAQDTQPSEARSPNYVDADNDGICDNRASCGKGKGRGCGYVDANGDGVCDHQGAGACSRGNGQGRARQAYVDANGDGVCDNQGAGEQHRRRGHGQGRGQGRGQGNR